MKFRIFRMLLGGLILGVAPALLAAEPRLANGKKIPGTVKSATDTGLEIESPKGTKVFPWHTLAASTRYEQQPSYRDNFEAVLAGLPASARTNRLDKAP